MKKILVSLFSNDTGFLIVTYSTLILGTHRLFLLK